MLMSLLVIILSPETALPNLHFLLSFDKIAKSNKAFNNCTHENFSTETENNHLKRILGQNAEVLFSLNIPGNKKSQQGKERK